MCSGDYYRRNPPNRPPPNPPLSPKRSPNPPPLKWLPQPPPSPPLKRSAQPPPPPLSPPKRLAQPPPWLKLLKLLYAWLRACCSRSAQEVSSPAALCQPEAVCFCQPEPSLR